MNAVLKVRVWSLHKPLFFPTNLLYLHLLHNWMFAKLPTLQSGVNIACYKSVESEQP